MATEAFDLGLTTPFVVLADEGDLVRAAARLGLTDADLLARLTRLEQQVRCRLIECADLRWRTTPAGTRFLIEARELLARADQLTVAMAAVPGRLRVHYGIDVSPLVRSLVTSFAGAHPAVEVGTAHGTDNEGERLLRAGEVDVTFVTMGQELPPEFDQLVVDRSVLGVVCRTGHRLAARPVRPWSDLDGERLMFPPPGVADAWSVAIRARLHRAGVTGVEVTGPAVHEVDELTPPLRRGDAVLLSTAVVAAHLDPDELTWVRLVPEQGVERAMAWNVLTADAVVATFVGWIRSRVGDAAPSTGTARPEDR